MNDYIDLLLSKDTHINEDNVERLCKLLVTIGERLDKEKYKETLNVAFAELIKMVEPNSTAIKTSRIRFEVMNIVELRASGWKPRENQRSSEICPMKLKDLEEIVREKQASLKR
jgi:translation initiation factor 4G